MLVEHARNLCGIADAVHGEYDLPGMRVVSLLACSLTDNEIEVQLTAGSRLHDLYNADTAVERTTCSYGLDPDHAFVAGLHGMRVAAIDDTGEVRAIERPAHPFFIATLFQPQLTTRAASPHPIWLGFINALEHP